MKSTYIVDTELRMASLVVAQQVYELPCFAYMCDVCVCVCLCARACVLLLFWVLISRYISASNKVIFYQFSLLTIQVKVNSCNVAHTLLSLLFVGDSIQIYRNESLKYSAGAGSRVANLSPQGLRTIAL